MVEARHRDTFIAMASTESAIHAVLCRIRDALHSLQLSEIESVLGPILTVIGATFDATNGVLQFARPVPAATLCRAFGWRRPYAVSADLQRWHIGVWADDLPVDGAATMQEIAVRPPQIGSWNLHPVLSRWPHGDTPLRCGPSPAYDLHSWPAMVSAIELSPGLDRECQLDSCGWIRIYDLALKRCEFDLTFRPVDRRTSHPLEKPVGQLAAASNDSDSSQKLALVAQTGRELTLLRLRARPDVHGWIPSVLDLDLEPQQSRVILEAMKTLLDQMPDKAAGSATGNATDVDLVDVFLPLSSGTIEATWYLDLDASRAWRRALGDRVTEIMIGLEVGFVGVRGSSTGEETVLLLSRAWADQADFYRQSPATAARLEGSPVIVAQLRAGDDAFIDLPRSFISPVRLDRVHDFIEGLASLMDDIHDEAVTGAAQGVRATTGFTTTVRANVDLGTGVELRDTVHSPSSQPSLQPLLALIQRFLYHANPDSGDRGQPLFTASPSSVTSPGARVLAARSRPSRPSKAGKPGKPSKDDIDEEALTNRPVRRDQSRDRGADPSHSSESQGPDREPETPAPPPSPGFPAPLSVAGNPLRTARLHGFPSRRPDDPDLTPVRSMDSYSDEIRLSARSESEVPAVYDDSVESSAPRDYLDYRGEPQAKPSAGRYDSFLETPGIRRERPRRDSPVRPTSPFVPRRPRTPEPDNPFEDDVGSGSQPVRRMSSSDDVQTPPVRPSQKVRAGTQPGYGDEAVTRPPISSGGSARSSASGSTGGDDSHSSYPPAPVLASRMSSEMAAELGVAATQLALDDVWERRRRRLWVDLMSDTGESQRVEIDKLQTIVGRADDCDVVVKDGAISRRHCSIAYDPEGGGRYVIKTLHKQGRMHYLGNRHWGRIAEIGKKTEERAIENGDVLVIGLTQLHFEVVDAG